MDLTPFKRAGERTTIHMSHFITKCMSNTLSTRKILQRRGHASNNLYPGCGISPVTIQNMYQCTYEGSCVICIVTVYALRKWLEKQNMDPEILIFCHCTPIHCRRRKIPATVSKPNSALWHPSHRLAIYNFRFHPQIPWTYTKSVFNSHGKQKSGTQMGQTTHKKIWKLIHVQWLHHSKINHTG